MSRRHAVLAALPGTFTQIQQRTGIATRTLRRDLAALHGTRIHVADWRRTRAACMPVWAAGAVPDVPKPPPLTKPDYNRRWRAKHAAPTFFWPLS